jgi:hypothetical protein
MNSQVSKIEHAEAICRQIEEVIDHNPGSSRSCPEALRQIKSLGHALTQMHAQTDIALVLEDKVGTLLIRADELYDPHTYVFYDFSRKVPREEQLRHWMRCDLFSISTIVNTTRDSD